MELTPGSRGLKLRTSPKEHSVDRRTSIFLYLIAAALLLPIVAPAAPADDVPAQRLRALMGDATYQAAGLDLLSEEEQRVLSAWLEARALQRPVPMPATTATYREQGIPTTAGRPAVVVVPPPSSGAPAPTPAVAARGNAATTFGLGDGGAESMESRIDGEFTGWNGDTVFHLQNGTVWEQTDNERLVVRNVLTNPKVTIERGFFGFRLRVDGYNSRVQVQRIQ